MKSQKEIREMIIELRYYKLQIRKLNPITDKIGPIQTAIEDQVDIMMNTLGWILE